LSYIEVIEEYKASIAHACAIAPDRNCEACEEDGSSCTDMEERRAQLEMMVQEIIRSDPSYELRLLLQSEAFRKD
jgi:hypothetical protein